MVGATIDVEVVFALPEKQCLVPLTIQAGATVAQAIDASAIESTFPQYDLGQCAIGIWGSIVERDRVLADGDRVELYRALQMDPREARRQLAAVGKTMGPSNQD